MVGQEPHSNSIKKMNLLNLMNAVIKRPILKNYHKFLQSNIFRRTTPSIVLSLPDATVDDFKLVF